MTVTFSCTDATSGIDSCTAPVTVSAEGANQAIIGTAVDKAGNTASVTASISVDKTPPTITATADHAPNANGWYNSPATISYTCSDGLSGVAVCSSPQTESTDGMYTLSGMALDNAGNNANVLTQVNVDQTAPVVTNVSWSANPLTQGQSTTLSASATDNLSGIASIYYTVNGGAPQQMTYNNASSTWQATLGANLTSNTYTIAVYGVDQAGNTSTGYMDVLTISSNSAVSGHTRLVPQSGDTLPVALDTAMHNPAELVVGFSGNNNGPNSIEAHYVVKNNQNEFDFSSTAIDWVVIPDTTHASIMVHGDMTTYVNGVMTVTHNVAMLVDVELGANGSADQVTVGIWTPSQNPSTDLPAYQVSEYDIANKSTMSIQ